MGEIQGRRLAGLLKAGRFSGASRVSGLRPLLPSLDARPSCLTRGMSAKSPRLCRLSPSGQGRLTLYRLRSRAHPLRACGRSFKCRGVPSSPFAVICCGTGASAWVGQVGTRCALTGRFTVVKPAEHQSIRAPIARGVGVGGSIGLPEITGPAGMGGAFGAYISASSQRMSMNIITPSI